MPDFSAQLEAIKAVIESLPDHGGKLDALANAIKALPDYSAQLEAIKTAIEALPNYGDKLTALENAIKALIGEIRIIAEPLRMEGISRG